MRKLLILLAGAAIMTTAACNTLAGAGRDVEAAGEAVTNTAESAK
jgi:predicted small secreted protein